MHQYGFERQKHTYDVLNLKENKIECTPFIRVEFNFSSRNLMRKKFEIY